jgi:hypothetical protein
MCLNDYLYLPQLAWIVVSCSPCNCTILVMSYSHITILLWLSSLSQIHTASVSYGIMTYSKLSWI